MAEDGVAAPPSEKIPGRVAEEGSGKRTAENEQGIQKMQACQCTRRQKQRARRKGHSDLFRQHRQEQNRVAVVKEELRRRVHSVPCKSFFVREAFSIPGCQPAVTK